MPLGSPASTTSVLPSVTLFWLNWFTICRTWLTSGPVRPTMRLGRLLFFSYFSTSAPIFSGAS